MTVNKLFVQCAPTDIGAKCFPNSNFAIKEIVMPSLPSSPPEKAATPDQREMFLNMQYYMEYCKANDYVTPQEWIENHKHF